MANFNQYRDPLTTGPNAAWEGHPRNNFHPPTMADMSKTPPDYPQVNMRIFNHTEKQPTTPDWAKPRGPMTAGQMVNGLNESVVQPIKKDILNAYWAQRAARAKYPLADAAVNFVPYIGIAANLDNAVHNIAGKRFNNLPMDVVDAAIGASTITGIPNTYKTIKNAFSNSLRPGLGDRAAVQTIGASGGAYGNYVHNQMDLANKAYGDRPIRDIANRMKAQGIGGDGL